MEGPQGQNGNKISQVAETAHKDGDLNISNTKSGKDKVTDSVNKVLEGKYVVKVCRYQTNHIFDNQIDIQEQEKKAIAEAAEQPKEDTKKSKEGGKLK